MRIIFSLFLGIIAFCAVSYYKSPTAIAAWPLNTPEIQTSPMWAGDDLVWNDNRLGNWDIFILHPDQTINALLAFPNNQALLSATSEYIYFFDEISQQNYIFNLKTATLKPYTNIIPEPISYHTLYDNSYETVKVLDQNIQLSIISAPSISLSADNIMLNNSLLLGVANGEAVTVRAEGLSTSFTATAVVNKEQWKISNLIPSEAPDDEYQLFGYATILTNISSPEVNLGIIIIDHTPPVLISKIELTPALDEVKIHWRTDEKSTAEIILTFENDVITKQYTRQTYSHTSTISNLYSNTTYKVAINSSDIYGNKTTILSEFTTLDINHAPLITVLEAKIKKELVWQAVIITEPGIIDEDVALVKVDDKSIILEWTVGLPPPNLIRGQTIRFIASLNHDKGALLIHGSKSLTIIDKPVEDIPIKSMIMAEIGQWFYFEGEITHLTKSYWIIKNNDSEIKIYWHNPPDGNWTRGQIVNISAIYYMNKEGINKLAGYKTDLISDVKKPETKKKSIKPKTSKVVPASIQITKPQLSNIASKKLVIGATSVTDKINLMWYSSVLIGLSFVTFIIFFIRHRRS